MKKNKPMKVLIPVIALMICGMVVLLERNGVTSEYTEVSSTVPRELEFTEAVVEEAECLVLTNSKDEVSNIYEEMACFVLDDMRIVYDVVEINEETRLDNLGFYKTMVITFQDWSCLGENLLTICDWVRDGGSMMNMSTPIPNGNFLAVAGKLGIENGGTDYVGITGIQVLKHCMIGGEEGSVFRLVAEGEEPLVTSLNVGLSDDCEVYITSEDKNVPLIWKAPYGEGNFVMINDTILDKYQRGFVNLAYTLLEDVCIYPVINSSVFYLDDFPSPVPEGNGEYIKEDYGVSIATFYSTIWWPRVLNWGEKYGIKYTSVIIEMYSDDVEAPFERNQAVSQFLTYGNMLLNTGGELGFHGYNHMPLCLEGIDSAQQYGDYELWKSKEDLKAAMTELYHFSSNLFPNVTFRVYVPPSNIMSEAGKNALLEACPDIKVLASIYLPSEGGYEFLQEFEVDEDGVIHAPRVVSGLSLDDYQKITAFSELNYHYVQSHFMHPDDLLDEDRGAAIGWEALSADFEKYLEWVYTSAPNIRSQTGSEMGTAIRQYDKLSVDRELENKQLLVRLGGFSGEAEFLMRVNEGKVERVEGGTFELITGNLYAVHAVTDEIKVYLR